MSMDELLTFKHLSLKSSQSDDEASQPNTATTSQNTTPGGTPTSTPATTRKGSTVLKLNINDSTWQIEKKAGKKRKRGITKSKVKGEGEEKAKKKKVNFLSTIPKRLENPDTRFRSVLAVLMASILVIVFLAQHLHKAISESHNVKMGIRIEMQTIKISNSRTEVLHGYLGASISKSLEAHSCSHGKMSYCFEWKYRARLEITVDFKERNVTCYNMHWKKSGHIEMEDSYNLIGNGALWYGMGEVEDLTWPIRDFHLDFTQFVTGQKPYGTIIKPYWLSSRGVGIYVHADKDPVLVSFNSSGLGQIQFMSKGDILNYTICKGDNSLDVHLTFFPHLKSRRTRLPNDTTTPAPPSHLQSSAQVAPSSTIDGNSTVGMFIKAAILTPQVDLQELFNQTVVQSFPDNFGVFSSKVGFVVLQSWWQRTSGDLDFDLERFPKPSEMVKHLHKDGARVLLEVDPYVCLNSTNFVEASENTVLHHDFMGIPLFTKWKNSFCSPVNFFNPAGSAWFIQKLNHLKSTYGIDGFVFQGGQSVSMPYHSAELYITGYLDRYMDAVKNISEYMGSPGTDRGYVILGDQKPTWQSLQSLPAKVMMIGLFGYNIINPGCVGGDIDMEGTRADRELYVRWLQLAVFMPIFQVCRIPSDLKNDFELVKIIRKLVNLRENRIIKAIGKALDEDPASPAIRPIWWLDPRDDKTYTAQDLFAVGNDIIVAPVLQSRVNETTVYLPAGNWCEDQTLHSGEQYINVTTPLDRVVYFVRAVNKCK